MALMTFSVNVSEGHSLGGQVWLGLTLILMGLWGIFLPILGSILQLTVLALTLVVKGFGLVFWVGRRRFRRERVVRFEGRRPLRMD